LRLVAGGWRLAAGGWRLAARGSRLDSQLLERGRRGRAWLAAAARGSWLCSQLLERGRRGRAWLTAHASGCAHGSTPNFSREVGGRRAWLTARVRLAARLPTSRKMSEGVGRGCRLTAAGGSTLNRRGARQGFCEPDSRLAWMGEGWGRRLAAPFFMGARSGSVARHRGEVWRGTEWKCGAAQSGSVARHRVEVWCGTGPENAPRPPEQLAERLYSTFINRLKKDTRTDLNLFSFY
jgi:hypothetical protein